MARFTLHGIWASGPTYKVGLLLSLAGEAFDYVHIDLQHGAHKQADYLKLNRFGVVPTLVDGNTGEIYAQSGAIMETVAELTGKFLGRHPIDRRHARPRCAERRAGRTTLARQRRADPSGTSISTAS